MQKIIAEAYIRVKILLKGKQNELEILAQALLEREVIFQSDLENLIGKRPFEKETNYQAYTNHHNNNPDVKTDQEIVSGIVEENEKDI